MTTAPESPSVPEAAPRPAGPPASPLLQVEDLVQEFTIRSRGGVRSGVLQAVSGVSFELAAGETLGIVGETGSGKSTLARSLLQAPPPKSGQVTFQGEQLVGAPARQVARLRHGMQMIFQDPYGSLDPKWTVTRIVEEPVVVAGVTDRASRHRRTAELLERVGLDIAVHGGRRPNELSGGQCQRVAIARALATEPRLIIADEAVSSLDVLVQAQVLNLFEELRRDLGLSYLFVAHDLALVKQVSDRVAVMYLGRLCEVGPADSLYRTPLHPYTRALLDAVPDTDPDSGPPLTADSLGGDPPSPMDPPSGCRFRTRCPRAQERCALEVPVLRPHLAVPGPAGRHEVACHFPLLPVTQAGATAPTRPDRNEDPTHDR